ncbi:MAG: hypothetical protein WBG18_14895 [Xanthobacteraceae bacterium]
MQLFARMLEGVTDSKCQFGSALVLRGALDVPHDLLGAGGGYELRISRLRGDVDWAPSLRPGRRLFGQNVHQFSYMRSDRFLDLRRPLHALKLDFGRSFHFSYLAMITGTYVGMIGCIDDYSRD